MSRLVEDILSFSSLVGLVVSRRAFYGVAGSAATWNDMGASRKIEEEEGEEEEGE